MGNPKQKWTQEEEQALRDGVAKYGAGKWKCIHNDPAFSIVLHSRSNIDLKDKWRNLSAAAQGLTTRSRPARPRVPEDSPAAPVTPVNIQAPAFVPAVLKPTANHVKEEPVKDTPDGKVSSRGSDTIGMVLEALGGANLETGLDIGAIVSYVEEKVTLEVPQSFRKQLGARLRKLVQQEKLEKVDNCYKLKTTTLVETNANNCKEVRPRPAVIPAPTPKVSESLQEAAKTAAYKVAEAEEKTYMAALSVRDAERLSKMQEESDAILQLAQEIYDKWHSNEVLIA